MADKVVDSSVEKKVKMEKKNSIVDEGGGSGVHCGSSFNN